MISDEQMLEKDISASFTNRVEKRRMPIVKSFRLKDESCAAQDDDNSWLHHTSEDAIDERIALVAFTWYVGTGTWDIAMLELRQNSISRMRWRALV